jgi:putative transposase
MDIIEQIKNKKIKGYLTIRNRIIYEGAIYHITQRAPGREVIFVEDSDYLKFLFILKKTAKKFDLDLFCFTLMPNHLHLLLKINKKNLSRAMQYLFQTYAFYYNIKYNRKGHVFCGRYRASLCNDDSYLTTASLYIHLNPYKAGLTKLYDDYRWSSLSLYTRKSKKTFIKYKEVLLLLDPDIKKARQKYSKMLKTSIEVPGGNLIDPKSVSGFIEKARRITKRFYRKDSELDELIGKFNAKKRVVKVEDKRARKYLIQQLQASGYSLKEISELLSICRMTLYNIIKEDLS